MVATMTGRTPAIMTNRTLLKMLRYAPTQLIPEKRFEHIFDLALFN